MSIIDSFFVALGFDVDTSGLKKLEREVEAAKETIISFGTLMGSVVAGLLTKEIAHVGSEFEQTSIQIAGFFQALGQSPDFDSALKDASDTIDQISAAAAVLPGEAEEYTEVFKDTFSFVRTAVGGTLKDMTNFTNQLTAIGKARNMDPGLIARETGELLDPERGRASSRNVLMRQLLPFMRQLEGQAKLTKEQFNGLTQQKRADLMLRSFGKLKPMLDHSAQSFDAMWGAAVSGGRKVLRLGTSGLFDGMKKGLAKINGAFFDSNFNLTEFGKTVVGVVQKVTGLIGRLVSDVAEVSAAFAQSGVGALALKVVLGALGLTLASLAFSKVAQTVVSLGRAIFNLKTLLTGGLVAAIALVVEDLYIFYTGGRSITGLLVQKWAPAIHVVRAALAGLLVVFARVTLGMSFWAIGLIALGATIYYVVTRWKTFGAGAKVAIVAITTALGVMTAAFIASKAAAIATLAYTAIGFAYLNAPLVIVVGTILAIAAAIYFALTRWNDFSAGAKVAIIVVATALGILVAAYLATKAAAIASAAAQTAAWLAALGPIGLLIAALGLLIVYWDQVSNAIYRAIDAAGEFFGIKMDSSGKKGVAAAQKKLDSFKFNDGFKKQSEADSDEEPSWLRKKGALPVAPAPGVAGAPGSNPQLDSILKKAGQLFGLGAANDATGGAGAMDMKALLRGIAGSEAAPAAASDDEPTFARPQGRGRAAAPAARTAASSSKTVNHETNVHVDKVEISSPDPKEAGKDFDRQVIRAHQTGVVL